jgi:hypothetical protein
MKKHSAHYLFSIVVLMLTAVACQKNDNSLLSVNPDAANTSSNVALAAAPPSDIPRAGLRAIINNVKGATARVYNLRDNLGNGMGTLKVIANPSVPGQFIGVYHITFNGVFKVDLATSTDLIHWTWVRELAGSNNGQASQPTIALASDGGFVMAWEQEPNNHIKVLYFSSWTNLKNGIPSKIYDCPRTLSNCAEGTPNIYSASSTSVDIGHHYYANCDVDKQARGRLTNFNSWTTSKLVNVDNAFLYWGTKGNIGDRDGYANFRGYNFGLFEAQFTKNDWRSWRVYLYDYQTGNSDQTSIQTNGGSISFANPTITLTSLNGKNIVLVTLFVPSEGNAPGEAGELLYYSTY